MNIHPWLVYSKKLQERILHPKHVGYFTEQEAQGKSMRLAVGQEGSMQEGTIVKLYLLVREADGVIEDVRFQAFGESSLIGIAESLCELLVNKNYAQASRISAELIDKKLRDQPTIEAFPQEVYRLVNLTLSALFEASELCQDIIITDPYSISPVSEGKGSSSGENHQAYWSTYTLDEQLTIIQEVIRLEIAPYVALDEGGVEVKELKNHYEVVVIYQGSCTSCFSATGATLNAIQQILKEKVHPNLIVTPDLSVLQF